MIIRPTFCLKALLTLLITLLDSVAVTAAVDAQEQALRAQVEVAGHRLKTAEAVRLPESEELRNELSSREKKLDEWRRLRPRAAAPDATDEDAAVQARLEAAERAAVRALEGRGPATRPARGDRDGDPRRDGPRDQGRREPRADASPRARLARTVPEIKFDGVAFVDAIDMLRDLTGLNIYVKWKTLEQAGVDRNAPVTLRLKDVTAERAMQFVLDDAAMNGGVEMTIDDGTVIVTSGADMGSYTHLRTYDVSDLLARGEGEQRADENGNAFTPEDRASSLLQVVQRTVAPGTWRDSGGSVGAVAVFGNKLVVTHVEKRQREVEALLEQLRAK
jgi:hypothetical protein